jgi:hypothetical protein
MSTAKGRPKGSTNRTYPRVQAEPPRCPACRSTDRDQFERIIANIAIGGTTPQGYPYTNVVKRKTRCRACGQYYAVTTYENHTAQEEPTP